MRLFAFAGAVFIAVFISSCARNSEPNNAEAKEINVAAAANLTDAFTELASEFTKKTGIKVVYSFGASADLAKQIENGAPFDVFASADVEQIDRLDKQGFCTPGTRNFYARGKLVLWIPPGSTAKVERIEDCAGPGVGRVGIAKPDLAPYGRATVESLHAVNVWTLVEPKAVYGQNVSQVRQYAATGNIDVAFLPLALMKSGDGSFIEVDEKLHAPINQALAAINASAKQDAARRFVDFVMSDEGQKILQRFGYMKPAERTVP